MDVMCINDLLYLGLEYLCLQTIWISICVKYLISLDMVLRQS